ncbi:LOW QUALITY PROTEIN: hypothetical protein V2J09_010239 [Rumex salicifolius]
MFEAHVLHLLQRYLGDYVHGLSAEALRISVWKGDVVLKDLKLKAEALNSLKLPVTVKAGFIGTITLKVPWKSLGKEPVIVLIDRVFILAHPAPYGWALEEEDRERHFDAKLRQIEELEASTIEAMSRSKQGNAPAGNSWLGSLIATIIGNLKVSISNIHIRYEDSVSNLGHPFACGVSLAKLAAVTMDEQGNETFDTSGALDKLRKSLQLERLAIYHDSNSLPWKIDKKWEALGPSEWIEIFEEGINEPATDLKAESGWALNRTYLVSPINGVLKYLRLGCQERTNPEIPFEKASIVLDDVGLTVTEAQYYDWIKLLEVISRYRVHTEVSHLRPKVRIAERPLLWWHYAAHAALQQRKIFSWEQIKNLCQLRRRYIQLYVGSLQRLSEVDNQEIRRIERDLDAKVILLWRLLAHAKVESAKSKEAALQRQRSRRTWFSFGWGSPVDESAVDSSESTSSTDEKLTKEEWQAINNLLKEEMSLRKGKDSQNMIKFLVDVAICQAAAKIIDINDTEVICGRFEQLNVSLKLKHTSTHCDVSLRFYGLSAPEGSLAQSVCNEQKENALAASFVRSPVGENVDWRLSATMCPCHVTFLVESFDRLMEFMRRSNAVSPTLAMETATALQMKLEKVTRRAQEQFQMVLEEQSRFALDIDFDAPKVRVPIRACAASSCDSHFLLDFGHFTLRTKDGLPDEENQSLYSRFYISVRDIAAFFTDCGSRNQGCSLIVPPGDSMSSTSLIDDLDSFCPLVDRCGMAIIFDQIKMPHPKFPSTRVSVQVPSLGIHISPDRYQRLADLVNILCNTMKSSTGSGADSSPFLAPWFPADLVLDARILVWKGIGHSLATWQPCYLVLSGLYLYVLESDSAQSYQQSLSMAGKQVCEVPPANVGGSALCLSVSFRGMEFHKALESSSTLIIEFRNEDDKSLWLKGLTKATYQASAPFSIDMIGESHEDMNEFPEASLSNLKAADLVINGTLIESKFFIYGKVGDYEQELLKETLIAEVLAGGGKVHVVRYQGDLRVKMKVHFLRIKDELQSVSTKTTQYLAYSVVKNDQMLTSPRSTVSETKEFASVFGEDEDIFADALQDFVPVSDSNILSDNTDYTGADSSEKGSARVRGSPSETFYEALGTDDSDFVTVIFMSRDPCSLDYDGIDTKVSICMSTLEFFVNRPTVVALIGFGLDMSSANSRVSAKSATPDLDNELASKREKMVDGDAYVKGLLGYGKARVVFNLSMNVDSVTVVLNKEDGSQLAMFIQESFVMDLKVHPFTMSIEGTLGNLRVCDKSIGDDHCWSWLCDIRNPGAESLIKFTFKSYSREDDDYEGYDYSLCGRLSAVRIVFLYRFVREFTAYFMGLATPHTEEVIKLVDKVGIEWFIEKCEVDGASAIKLDLSLDAPIIVIPKDSTSKDCIQLDLGVLEVKNELIWHGCPENDPSAVHLDVLRAEIQGINMAVGIDGVLGKPMIREGHGFVIYVRRSLRDIFRKVPTLSIEVQMDSLHILMLDKEYHVILDCATTNLNEEPRLPPSFRSAKPGSEDSMKLLVNKVYTDSQSLLSQTVTIMAVRISHALLELCNAANEGSRLAQIALEGLWVSYRMTSLSEADLYVTVPKFSILDVRHEAKPEMRLMLGPSADVYRPSGGGLSLSSSSSNLLRSQSAVFSGGDIPTSTMLLFDFRWRAASQSSVVRIQEPRVLVVPDFLLAVIEFFVPALGTITGREELMNPKNDPICKSNSIILTSPVYKQQEEVIELSSSRQLIADCSGVDEYLYDGCGKTICLREELQSLRSQPIVVIGRGKSLRFVNVKIENGSLLRKYTYLSNDSCYSTSPEDGVDIVLVEKIQSDDIKCLDYIQDISDTSDASSCNDSELKKTQSLTFEAQVVSPEFTFYDGTKSSQADSLHGEKLLRVKMDLNLMYASKEDDMWVRALVKDISIEAGSGLVILDPVDISGGYTSVKDKINMSLISTDVHFHLSLSVISLLLNLQNQASTALQYADSNPLAPCINYERIWVSPTENGSHYNLTFWRPRAPSNYVVLGDCVTSRPIPPSQAVMAMSSTYGRVRKPLGFSLIGSLSSILGGESQSSMDRNAECSLWFPVAPPGYKAVGCVAHIGSQPPSTHIVYCVRADLVTSTTYSECIYSSPASPHMMSGFSIWRLDNSLGSFFAQPSVDRPSNEICYDLVQCLLWSTNWQHSSLGRIKADSNSDNQRGNNRSAGSSGWDIVRSYSRANNYCISTPNFERIWWDKGGELRRSVSIWRPIARLGYCVLGDCITDGLEPPSLGIIFLADNPEVSAKPVQFTKVAKIIGKGVDEAFFWYPIAPPGYASMGCVVTRTDEPPRVDAFCCPRMDLVSSTNILEVPISRSLNSKASHCWSIWKVENQGNTFLARPDLKKPSSRLAFAIGDFTKPKTRENVTADMKLRCFSVTVLDSLCGMMTPLFDMTIANIKLATHGRWEAMNAVLVSSMAASTFNAQLESWEPLVEPFDGIFKFETYETNVHPTPGLGKRVRIAATSVLNMNISAANLETFTEAALSWRRQKELEQKAAKINEEDSVNHGNEPSVSALDEDDFQTIIIENKLGCEIYLKKFEQNIETVELLHPDGSTPTWVPPPRFAVLLNHANESREPRYYVAVNIIEVKGVPFVDDGNGCNLFCALRLVVDNQPTDQQKLFPQSARTKCVQPLVMKTGNTDVGTAKWNELFIFEVPRKGVAKLEVELTNLAAKAGKGEVVGASCFPVGHGTNKLTKVASSRMLHLQDFKNFASYPLRKKDQAANDESVDDNYGFLQACTSYFERARSVKLQKETVNENDNDADVGFWVSLSPEGPWESTRSLLPLSVVPKYLGRDLVAMEVGVRNGKKHAVFRGLATVKNDTDVNLDIATCPVSVVDSRSEGKQDKSMKKVVTLLPGTIFALPWQSMCRDSEHCLQIRPTVDSPHLSYSWGLTAAVGYLEQSLLSRQSTMKQGNRMASSAFKLDQLDKKDVLLSCSPRSEKKQFWLSAGTDASVLHTELNVPVYDWNISINAPLRLENRLPCPAEFTIWERTREGKGTERQQGIIMSRKSVNIYTADIQKPIYMSLYVQGGWVLEKDPLLILDLSSNDQVSSFWIVHQKSRRRLRVSIELDTGSTNVAPKVIRFFVPYWIINDSSMPLSYRVVEIEPLDNADVDNLIFSRAAKSAKMSTIPRKNVQVLDTIEDSSPSPSMLSPQDYVGRGGVMLFTSRNDTYLSPKVGISVAVRRSDYYSPGISLLELEKKGRVDVKAFNTDGSYYNLSAQLNMTSDRTKVVHFQPHTLYINRVGFNLCLRQCGTESMECIHPTDPPKLLRWQSSSNVEMLKLSLDGCRWSKPFSVGVEGFMRISLDDVTDSSLADITVTVRSGTKSSRYEVIFRPKSFFSPYRIENRSMLLPIRFRQADGSNDSWKLLPPNAAAAYLWEDIGRQRLLEILVDGSDTRRSVKYNIDEIVDHQPNNVENGPASALRVTIIKEEKINVVKITDWMPDDQLLPAMMPGRVPSSISPNPRSDSQSLQSHSDTEFHIFIELSELGISVIDHTPEEILYLSVQNLLISHSTGLGSGISRFKLRMLGIQVDNQLPLSPMPVLFRPQKVKEDIDSILKIAVTSKSDGSLDLCAYPYIGLQVPENSSFLINIHEPIIWRLHEMIQQVNISRLYDTKTNAVSIDPIIEIGVLNISEVRLKVSMTMSPTQRPKGVLGFWSSLMTALGNMENMTVRIHQRFVERVSMRQSVIISNATSNIQKDLLSQPLQLLSGVDILGNASSALGHMSKGVAALSMDKKFIQGRMRQESKGVEDFGDVIRDGGGALAKGFFRGVTGILTKPLEGAKASGMEGFVQGVGKGIIGAAAQPVSGVLDLLSKTTEGANAMRMKILAALTSEDQLLRRRLPRVISADNLLRPYDEDKAKGQVMLQLAESGAFFGQVDLFRVRGKFALSDAYEDHFMLPKGRVLIVTHRRAILLQQPSSISQKKFIPAKDPCTIVWDVLWDDLITMELTNGKKESPTTPPSRLVLYLHAKSVEQKDHSRVVKCTRDSHQAIEVYNAIAHAMSTYGPNQFKGSLKGKVSRPYSPLADQTGGDCMTKEGFNMLSPSQVPTSVPTRSIFGSSSNIWKACFYDRPLMEKAYTHVGFPGMAEACSFLKGLFAVVGRRLKFANHELSRHLWFIWLYRLAFCIQCEGIFF